MELIARSSLGNVKAKALRKRGLVPGVLYGKNMNPISVVLDKKDLKKIYQEKRENEVFDVNLNGQTHTVYIHEVQRDVIDDKEFIHFDLHKVTNEDFIHTHVPVVLVNKDQIESQGLVVQQQLLDVEVKYPVYNKTTEINVDMSQLYNGGSLTVADLTVPQGVSVLNDRNAIVASVSYPKMHEPIEDIDEVE
ncbi:50S ribosomal protein L25 [Tepidibacter thalassicus]|uniref:Large ribosomal subunit protein bL25 n=1 Tax=Tepidibacter thalassicus DSM 15285 TaxID=1123350 RepID=A0A1M5TWA2_9FIRM|nr:50S ribosomal protein L25 [Tepidibacter thalassicus]SHH54941.1 large subunit ribosomal protein L25 [Tepidibacter thalassicus DSM 15285]